MTAIAGESPAGARGGAKRAVDLAIGGMTCASCAARIEKKLNKLAGVTATVNFATEKARVSFPAAISPDDLISVVEQAGYTATLPAPPPAEPSGAAAEPAPPDELAALRQRLLWWRRDRVDQVRAVRAAALDALRSHGFGEAAARKWLQRHRPEEAVNAWPRGQRPRPAMD